MTAKTILALAQTHRKEPSRANYAALADAVRALVAERDALRKTARAVVDRWDTPHWKDAPATAVFIGALRKELGE